MRFDFLKSVMALMILGTLGAGVWGVLSWRRMEAARADVNRQVQVLKDAMAKAQDPALLKLIRVVREKKVGGAKTDQGLASYLQYQAQNMNLAPEIKPLGEDTQGGVKEESIRLILANLGVQPMVEYLVAVLKEWPGLKIKKLDMHGYSKESKKWRSVEIDVAFYTRV